MYFMVPTKSGSRIPLFASKSVIDDVIILRIGGHFFHEQKFDIFIGGVKTEMSHYL